MLCHQKIGSTFLAALLVLCLGWEVRAEVMHQNIDVDNTYVPQAMKDLFNTTGSAQFRLVFVTDGSYISKQNIAWYNGQVTAAANGVPALLALGMDWYVIGSTSTISAKVNTATDSGVGVPIFRLDGVLVSSTYPGLWDGGIDNPINYTPTGSTYSGLVLTGTKANGDRDTNGAKRTLTSSGDNWLTAGKAGEVGGGWIMQDTGKNNNRPLYGMSGVFNVIPSAIPEPGTLALLGMALLGVGWYVWRRRVPKIAVAAIIAFGLTAAVNAETISIVASDNAWGNKDAPTDDQNEAELFKVGGNGTTWHHHCTYLRFDLSPLAGATITSASLDVYWLSSSAINDNTVSVCALNDLAVGPSGTTETSWSGNLTWNTRPDGTGGMPNANTSNYLASRSFTPGAPKTLVSFDLTSALPGLLATDTNKQLTLILYGRNKVTQFASLANTKNYPVPTLNVGYEPIPEPGTLALLGMALLGVAWWQNILSVPWHAWRKAAKKGLASLLAVLLLWNALLGLGWYAWRRSRP